MEKKCTKCGSSLPEEASFCLHCFSFTEDFTPQPVPAAVTPEKTYIKTILSRGKWVAACFLILVLAVIGSAQLANRIPAKAKVIGTTVVAVTDEYGETVTDSEGEPVFEVQEITTTEEKENIIQRIFNNKEDGSVAANNRSDDNAEPAGSVDEINEPSGESVTQKEKKSLFDRLFGNWGNKDSGDGKKKETTTESKNEKTGGSSSQTESPSVTNTTESSTRENTTKESTTKENTTNQTTQTTVTQTSPEVTQGTQSGSFEWDEYNGKARLVKYTGNEANVTVPATHNGNDVAYMSAGAFSDNSYVKTIKFLSSDSVFYLQEKSSQQYTYFKNMPNLKNVTFPQKTYIVKNVTFNCMYNIFKNCPKLESVNFDNAAYGSTTYLWSMDGVVFFCYNLVFYPYGRTSTSYTTPDACTGISRYAVMNNPYLTSFTIGNGFSSWNSVLEKNFTGCTNINQFKLTSGCPESKLSTKDGILYMGGTYVSDDTGLQSEPMFQILYPQGKDDNSYAFDSSKKIWFTSSSFCGNTNIQTIKVPEGSRFEGGWANGLNIKKVRLKDCDDSRLISSSNFRGMTVEYY